MVPYLGCEHAREMLQAFIDGELPVEAQVALETHLRWCRTCAAHIEDLRVIGDVIRSGRPGTAEARERELATVQAQVLGRLRVEREQSLAVQIRSLYDDRHLLWAGLGATTALVVCLFGTMSVLHAASSVERPDSLAGVLESMANPGSDRNPMLLDGRLIQAPRAMEGTLGLEQLGEEEAVFALAAVVTREGRIANYEVLASERDRSRGRRPASRPYVTTLLDKLARSRFTPAEQGVARAPVAVNMVWLLARTTVRGTPRDIDFRPPQEPVQPEPPPVVPAAKPAGDVPDTQAVKPSAYRSSSMA